VFHVELNDIEETIKPKWEGFASCSPLDPSLKKIIIIGAFLLILLVQSSMIISYEELKPSRSQLCIEKLYK
jgi:hypothetical protein